MKPRFDHKIIRPRGAWVPAAATNVARTFARIRKQQAAPKAPVVAEIKNRRVA